MSTTAVIPVGSVSSLSMIQNLATPCLSGGHPKTGGLTESRGPRNKMDGSMLVIWYMTGIRNWS
jgi:hypothetical protein